MDYTLIVRAFFSIKRKDKAVARAAHLFPDLPIRIIGKYYKDNSLWEATLQHDCEYDDDKTALWETLTYFSEIEHNWLVSVWPNSPQAETVIDAVAEKHDNTGLAWCHFELLRRDTSP